MHFMNPVPVMKLVELIRGMQTSDEVGFHCLRPLFYPLPGPAACLQLPVHLSHYTVSCVAPTPNDFINIT